MMAQVHLEMLRLARRGASVQEIAAATGIPAAAIAVILRSPLAQAELVRAA